MNTDYSQLWSSALGLFYSAFGVALTITGIGIAVGAIMGGLRGGSSESSGGESYEGWGGDEDTYDEYGALHEGRDNYED